MSFGAAIVLQLGVAGFGGLGSECWHEQARLEAGIPAPGADLGGSVRISGDTLVAGMPRYDGAPGRDSGAASIYRRTAGAWTLESTVEASDAAADTLFGVAVGVSGDVVVVGALFADVAVPDDQTGAAYVYRRDAGGAWLEEAKLVPAGARFGARFGRSVAIEGETIVVGAYTDDSGLGSAYVFERSGGVWQQTAKLSPSGAAPGSLFGTSVAISGGTIVGGAQEDAGAAIQSGGAYVFERSGAFWTQSARLLAADGESNDDFGVSVGVSGDVVVVGAIGDDTVDRNAGAAYVFVRDGASWSPDGKIFGDDSALGDSFGSDVGIDGDRLAVGAYAATVGARRRGTAYAFVRGPIGFVQTARFIPSDGEREDLFGISVAIDGESITVGMPGDDNAVGVDAGSAFVFVAEPDTTPPVLQRPERVRATADESGEAIVTFEVTAVDACDPAVVTTCEPPSGSLFPIGTTAVSCTATDASGNSATCSFDVEVLERSIGCRQGNVNAGAGPIADVVLVNGSAGSDPERVLHVDHAAPFRIDVTRPPSAGSEPVLFALYAHLGAPDEGTVRELPKGIGCFCLPIPLSGGGDPGPRRIWSSFPPSTYHRLGTPTDVVHGAPITLSFALGVHAATFTLQALVLDTAAPNGKAAVTNAVVVIAE